jgi:hypothetical protein
MTCRAALAVLNMLLAFHVHTHVKGDQGMTLIVRDHVVVIGAFADGWLCYENEGRIACHKAIAKPTYREIR